MADRTKGRLWEKCGGELVALDVVDFGLFDSSSAVMQGKEAFGLQFTHVFCVCRQRRRGKVRFCSMIVTVGWDSGNWVRKTSRQAFITYSNKIPDTYERG